MHDHSREAPSKPRPTQTGEGKRPDSRASGSAKTPSQSPLPSRSASPSDTTRQISLKSHSGRPASRSSIQDQDSSDSNEVSPVRASIYADQEHMIGVFLAAFPRKRKELEEDLKEFKSTLTSSFEGAKFQSDKPTDLNAVLISAFANGYLVGFLQGTWEMDRFKSVVASTAGKTNPELVDSTSLYIQNMAVAPDMQRHGLGSAMLQKCLKRAKQQAKSRRQQIRVHLDALGGSKEWYKNRGFQPRPVKKPFANQYEGVEEVESNEEDTVLGMQILLDP